ncbi:MAG: lipase family protein [Flavitalea sp.]
MRFLFALLLIPALSFSQEKLKPGFDIDEYLDVLSLAFHSSSIPDSTERLTKKDRYNLVYRSVEKGFMYRWTYYRRDDNVGVIDSRGTINVLPSWMGNFYSAMVPATGTLNLDDTTVFQYRLAENKAAMVHIGWLVALGYLGPDMINQINIQYKESGTKEFILSGHSQGAAITFLVRSYLEYQQKENKIPGDVKFKTYCSAAPKPGNLYYAYDFDFINRGGWQFTVNNSADWVPETPFTVQTLTDFNETNPFRDAKAALKKQKFLVKIAGTTIYNKVDRATRKAQKRYTKYFGKLVYKQAKSIVPQLKEPEYSKGINYVRAGTPVILMADEDYLKLFPDSRENAFAHHLFKPYNYLARKWYKNGTPQ